MRLLVTGATGRVGHAVTRALPVRGDVRDNESLVQAVRGCGLVFNAMGCFV